MSLSQTVYLNVNGQSMALRRYCYWFFSLLFLPLLTHTEYFKALPPFYVDYLT